MRAVFDWEPPASHFDAVMLCSEIIISVCGTLLFGYEIRLTGAQTSQEEFDTITAESGEVRAASESVSSRM